MSRTSANKTKAIAIITVPHSLVVPKSIFTLAASCLTSRQSDHAPGAPRRHLKQGQNLPKSTTFARSARAARHTSTMGKYFTSMHIFEIALQILVICHGVFSLHTLAYWLVKTDGIFNQQVCMFRVSSRCTE